MERKRYSSMITPMYRDVFPGIGVAFLCAGVTVTIADGRSGLPFLFFGIVWSAFTLPYGVRLKHVDADDTCLYVVGRKGETAIPLREIVGIPLKTFASPRCAFAVFRERTSVGKSVMFIPEGGEFLSTPSSVEELRLRAGFSGEWRRAV